MVRFALLYLILRLTMFAPVALAEDAETTRVTILGVTHAGQLFARPNQPAVLRAWLERVKPAAIAVERHPDALARNDFYGFTYEIQDILLPWARAARVPAYPFDWEPSPEDLKLAFGFDVQTRPLIRTEAGWGAFVSFDDTERAKLTLFEGERRDSRDDVLQWSSTPASNNNGEVARRLYLFRTFLQAQRIRHAAAKHRGETLVVVVGSMHQPDLEEILGRDPNIALVPAVGFGMPTDEEVQRQFFPVDAIAIAWVNLFGMQSMLHDVDMEWMDEVVGSLDGRIAPEEYRMLSLRRDELSGRISPNDALQAWRALAERTPADAKPSWTGVIGQGRMDSDFDPFARLTLRQRALHEASRLTFRLSMGDESQRLRDDVVESLPESRRPQYLGYWKRYVADAKS